MNINDLQDLGHLIRGIMPTTPRHRLSLWGGGAGEGVGEAEEKSLSLKLRNRKLSSSPLAYERPPTCTPSFPTYHLAINTPPKSLCINYDQKQNKPKIINK